MRVGSNDMLRVDRQRLLGALAALAQIGKDPSGGVTRPAYSAADMEARRWLARRMEELGMHATMDAVGNVSGRLGEGDRALLLGSHSDTVPRGGHLDGALGVLSALECVRVIQEAGRRLSFPIEVIAFADEEGRRARGARRDDLCPQRRRTQPLPGGRNAP